MAVSTRVAPPNSLVLIEDSSGSDIPTSMNQSLIAATDSCIAIGCRAEDDGETEIVLEHCSSVDTDDRLEFEGLLRTPELQDRGSDSAWCDAVRNACVSD